MENQLNAVNPEERKPEDRQKRRWTNQYIHLVSTKPELISTFPDRTLRDQRILSLQNEFSKYSQIFCELGSGAGAHMIAQARLHPSTLIVGFELRFKRIFKTAEKAERCGIHNIRVLQLDARFISKLFYPEQIDGIYVNFPDPWADKRRWKKNRLLNSRYLDELAKVLKPSGFISYKSDHFANFCEVRDILKSKENFEICEVTDNLYQSAFLAKNVSSEFERLFELGGQSICYLKAKKIERRLNSNV